MQIGISGFLEGNLSKVVINWAINAYKLLNIWSKSLQQSQTNNDQLVDR